VADFDRLGKQGLQDSTVMWLTIKDCYVSREGRRIMSMRKPLITMTGMVLMGGALILCFAQGGGMSRGAMKRTRYENRQREDDGQINPLRLGVSVASAPSVRLCSVSVYPRTVC
jgi:hypothetical protein